MSPSIQRPLGRDPQCRRRKPESSRNLPGNNSANEGGRRGHPKLKAGKPCLKRLVSRREYAALAARDQHQPRRVGSRRQPLGDREAIKSGSWTSSSTTSGRKRSTAASSENRLRLHRRPRDPPPPAVRSPTRGSRHGRPRSAPSCAWLRSSQRPRPAALWLAPIASARILGTRSEDCGLPHFSGVLRLLASGPVKSSTHEGGSDGGE